MSRSAKHFREVIPSGEEASIVQMSFGTEYSSFNVHFLQQYSKIALVGPAQRPAPLPVTLRIAHATSNTGQRQLTNTLSSLRELEKQFLRFKAFLEVSHHPPRSSALAQSDRPAVEFYSISGQGNRAFRRHTTFMKRTSVVVAAAAASGQRTIRIGRWLDHLARRL